MDNGKLNLWHWLWNLIHFIRFIYVGFKLRNIDKNIGILIYKKESLSDPHWTSNFDPVILAARMLGLHMHKTTSN